MVTKDAMAIRRLLKIGREASISVAIVDFSHYVLESVLPLVLRPIERRRKYDVVTSYEQID